MRLRLENGEKEAKMSVSLSRNGPTLPDFQARNERFWAKFQEVRKHMLVSKVGRKYYEFT